MGRYCIYDLLLWRPMSYGDLEVLLRSRVPLIVVESRDETRVLKLLQRACRRAPGVMPAPVAARADDLTGRLPQGLPLFEWTITDGLRRLDSEGGGNQRNLSDPTDVLRHIRATNLCAVYALVDLRYEHDSAAFSDVGGLAHFKAWLEPRRAGFDGSAPALDPPRGVLLLGVQGCGKSLAARAAAAVFGLPLLSLDCAALFDKFVGETERNLRESLSTAELMAPCVLWIDEIEKGFATGDADSGTSRRVMGSFLTWLAEKRTRVFVLATANDITSLPPELIRKGRFDEIFFVDLPDAVARREIIGIHLRKRSMSYDDRTLALLVHASEGFSGAEIEQAVVATLYTANARHAPPSAQAILAEMSATRPLSILMAERISALRRWAAGRAVPAG
jgi:hypothetical protein